jgi:hypothetical protein
VIRGFARRRLALGVAPAIVPAFVWMLLGLALGPHGLGVLSGDVLAHLDAVVSVALATLGVFVGLALAPRARGAARLLAAAAIESGVTAAMVGGAAAILFHAWRLPLAGSTLAAALALAAAAAGSSAGAADEGRTDDHAVRVADLDDVVPIVLAAAVCGWAGSPPLPPIGAVLGAAALGGVLGLVGWLLFERTPGDAERGVFVLGVLALVGGAAAYAGVSPLVAGMAAGLVWRRMPGRADEIVAADLRRFHHPLIALLLAVAGAQMWLTPLALFLLAAFVVFRLAGKVIGGIAAARLAPVPGDVLGAYLVSPGAIGVAIALNVQQLAPADGAAIVAAVAAGTLLFESMALLLPQPDTAG